MKIDSVKVKNFKSLKDIDIKLNNLTLITGVNSSGKSSFIQSLLLFKENLNNIICFGKNFRKNLIAKHYNKLNNKTPYDILGIVDNEIIQQMSFNGDYINAGDPKMLLSQESFGDSMIFEILNNEHKFNISINEQLELKHDKDSDNKILEIFNDSTFDYLIK
jgi:predicted ATPase